MNIWKKLTCSLPLRLLSQPMYFNSPIIVVNVRFASINAFCVLQLIAECNALNHMTASCWSIALNIHEWIPSGECNSMQRFSLNEKNQKIKKISYKSLGFSIHSFYPLSLSSHNINKTIREIKCWRFCLPWKFPQMERIKEQKRKKSKSFHVII